MDQQTATRTLDDLDRQQRRARRAARPPWWFFVATFLVVAVVCATNDIVSGVGARVIAVVIMAVLVAVLAFRMITGSAPLGRARGVQARTDRSSRRSSLVLIIGGLVGWVFAEYGVRTGARIAEALHLSRYPYTVTGVLAGAVFTGVLLLAELVRRPANS